jgi:aspartate aminotransferase-like enzyme
LEQRKTPIQGWYANLLVWRDVWMKRQSGYFTFPVTLLYGLRAALDLMFSISLPELYRRYAVVARAIRQAVLEMGLELVANCRECPGCDATHRFCADTVTAIRYPPGVCHEDFAQLMHDYYGISIAGTYGPLAGKAFRVGPAGLLQVERGFTLHLLSSMGLALRQLGFPAPVEQGLVVADEILAELESP